MSKIYIDIVIFKNKKSMSQRTFFLKSCKMQGRGFSLRVYGNKCNLLIQLHWSYKIPTEVLVNRIIR